MIFTWILLGVLFLYTKPLWFWRYQFRTIIYKDKRFIINIKPVFIKEFKALFSNKYFKTKKEMHIANRYRLYLTGLMILLILIKITSKLNL